MSTSLDFFPLVGAVIGALVCLINIGPAAALDPVVRALASVLIPILVTGGFHLDGFMDTSDALNSYGEPGKKLEILKDPHIGAFAVISLVKLLIAAIAFSVLLLTWKDPKPETVVACGLIFVERGKKERDAVTGNGERQKGDSGAADHPADRSLRGNAYP